MRVMCILCTFLLAGCETFGTLDGPPAWCMQVGEKGDPYKQGDDLVQKTADQQQTLDAERAKNRCLRKYARAVTG
jgi:hypothetical protein